MSLEREALKERVGGGSDVRFEKGKAFPLPIPVKDGALFSIEPYNLMLVYYYNRPTAEEEKAFMEGRFEMAVTEVKGIEFILTRFEGLGWTDAPYSSAVASGKGNLPELVEGNLGYALDAFLVDSDSCILRQHRLVRLTPAFSAKFKALIEKERERNAKSPMTESEYLSNVQTVYANYSVKDLLRFKAESMKEDK